MKYQIDWAERKTSSKGMSYWKASLTAEDGSQISEVALFGFSDEAVRPGSSVEGVLEKKDFMGKPSYSLSANKSGSTGGRGAGIAQAQAKKAEDIKNAQENKEESIMISSTFRDATLITTSLFPELAGKEVEIKIEWLKWRKWLLDNWK